MKKMRSRKAMGAVVAVVMTLAAVFAAPEVAKAESVLDSYTDEVQARFLYDNSSPCMAYEKGAVIEDLKSSDESIVTVEADCKINGDDDHDYIFLDTKGKAGKVDITFKYTLDGSTRDYDIQYKFVKFSNGFKSFKIGKTEYAKNYKSTFYFVPKKMKSGKLSIKANKGWTLDKIEVWDNVTFDSIEVDNNTRVSLDANKTVYVTMTHKSGIVEHFRLGKV